MSKIDMDKMVEVVAEAIWEADTRKGATWQELLVLNATDGYLNAKTSVRITKEQAKAAIKAFCKELPYGLLQGAYKDGSLAPDSRINLYQELKEYGKDD